MGFERNYQIRIPSKQIKTWQEQHSCENYPFPPTQVRGQNKNNNLKLNFLVAFRLNQGL